MDLLSYELVFPGLAEIRPVLVARGGVGSMEAGFICASPLLNASCALATESSAEGQSKSVWVPLSMRSQLLGEKKPLSHLGGTEEDFSQDATFRQKLGGLVGVFQAGGHSIKRA